MGTGWQLYPAAQRGVPAYRQAGKQQPASQVEKKEKDECPQIFLAQKKSPAICDRWQGFLLIVSVCYGFKVLLLSFCQRSHLQLFFGCCRYWF